MKRDLNLIRRIIDCVFVRPISAVQCIRIYLGGSARAEAPIPVLDISDIAF